jgi:uncharacterized delta-60 repeat protein
MHHEVPAIRLIAVALVVGLSPFMLGSPALAAAGAVDPTFSGDGKVTTAFPGNSAEANGAAVQSNGKIVAVGATFPASSGDRTFALTRYLSGGSLDPTFGGDGRVSTASFDEAFDVAIQADGKIVVSGAAGQAFALARYNTNGSLDATFGGDGKVTTPFAAGAYANAVAIQTDGKIVAAGEAMSASGEFLFALARYRSNGTLDPTFSADGKVTTAFAGGLAEALDLAVQDDGKIVAAGRASDPTFRPRIALARYLPGGTLDPDFSGDGQVITTFPGDFAEAFTVVLQDDGKIVAAGDTRPGQTDFLFALVRYRPGGALDPTFGGDGRVTTRFASGSSSGASDVAIEADGTIVAGGSSLLSTLIQARFAVARYRPDGAPDPTFSGDGKVTTMFPGDFAQAASLDLQSDGKIVASGFAISAGTSRFALVRYVSS